MRKTLFISLILFLSVFIYAQKVLIGVYENYPIVYKTSGNELQGILIDCFKIISEKSDYDFDFVYKTWPELLGDFENGTLDIITGIAYTSQREEQYFFSSEYISSEWGQIYTNSDSHITSYLDLQNKKIVYIKDSYFFDSPAGILNILKSFRIDAIFLSVDTFQQAFDLVSNNLADAAVATRYQGYFFRNTYKIKETAMMFSPIELRYAAKKNDSYAIKVINYIDSQMHLLKSSPDSPYYVSIKKHLPKEIAASDLPLWVVIIITLSILAIAVLFLFWIILKKQVKIKTKELEQSNEKLYQNYQELESLNEELSSTEEELLISHNRAIASEKRYRSIFNQAPVAMMTLDKTLHVTDYNMGAEKIFGWKKEEIIGVVFYKYIFTEHDITFFDNFLADKSVKIPEYFVTENMNKSGDVIICEWINSVIEDQKGNIIEIVSISRNITENKKLEESLRKAKDSAEKASKAKSEFLANMSHEIRTPINGVIGISDLILETELDEEQKNYMQMIKTSSRNLLRIVNDILDISKIEAGKIELNNVSFHVLELKENIMNSFFHLMKEKGLDFKFFIQENIPTNLNGDLYKINQILSNLVGNAYKFTDKGYVHVKTEKVHEDSSSVELLFNVTDTGIGIKPEKINIIFDIFTQGDSSATKKYQGTGLGLTIAKSYVEKMGGKIFVVSTPGEGSSFSFIIPIKKDISFAAEKPPEDEDTYLHDYKDKKILVAEDNQINLYLTKKILSKKAMEVLTAENGAKAVEIFEKERPDLIFMDLQMPELDGLGATLKIRQIEKNHNTYTPIIALTAYATKEDKERCLAQGMDGFIAKPFTQKDILGALRTFLA